MQQYCCVMLKQLHLFFFIFVVYVVDLLLPYTAQQHRRVKIDATPLWKPEISHTFVFIICHFFNCRVNSTVQFQFLCVWLVSVRLILILSSHLHLSLSAGCFLLDSWAKLFIGFIYSSVPTHFIFCVVTIQMILHESKHMELPTM